MDGQLFPWHVCVVLCPKSRCFLMMSSWDGKSNPSFQVTHPVSFCVAPLTFELNSDVFPFFPLGNS